MTLQGDIPILGRSLDALSECILENLTQEFDRIIFLVGAPAESDEYVGNVFGVATEATVVADLQDANIELGSGVGLIGGVTGTLVSACYHADVPAAVLVVKANSYLPDPAAARSVIEEALEPLVHFDTDTTALEQQAEQIRRQLEQIAQRYQQMLEVPQNDLGEPIGPVMYQ